MTYLCLGEDNVAKEKKINEIKQRTLTTSDALKFDYEILRAPKLDPDTFKKSLISLPAVSKKRCVLLRTVDKLSPANKEILLDHIARKEDHCELILETSSSDTRQSLLKKLLPLVKVYSFLGEIKSNVFDMTKAMGAKMPAKALKILDGLIEGGDHPLQIMGALVWFWGKNKGRLSGDKFQEGLRQLQEADGQIKRSRLKPEMALEILVIKLSSLLAY